MSKPHKKTLSLIFLLITTGSFAWVISGAMRAHNSVTATKAPAGIEPNAQGQSPRQNARHRNLSLQPEAFNMVRRLGQRLGSTITRLVYGIDGKIVG